MTNKKYLLNKLIALRENGPRMFSCGICANVDDCREIIPYYDTWSHYSGSTRYPVPSTDEHLKEVDMYWNSNNKWVGEYGDLRRNLLDHLITEISKEVDNEEL